MKRGNISTIGLYNYRQTLFDDIVLPDGVSLETLKNTILFTCGRLEVIYPDWDLMRFAISTWSNANREIWDKLYKTTKFEYNPIWNKDGTITEEWTEKRNTENNGDITRKDEERNGGTVTNNNKNKTTDNVTNNNTNTATGTVTTTGTEHKEDKNKVSGYNSEVFVNKDYKIQDGNGKNTTENNLKTVDNGSTKEDVNSESQNVETINTNNIVNGNTKTSEKGTEDIKHDYKRVEQGNIGLTSTQQLINEEREVARFNIYEFIANDYKNKFCVCVY